MPRRKASVSSAQDFNAELLRPTSRYATVAHALLDDIRSEVYRVGALLPTEAELQEKFDVSRHTVRQALRELKELGIITSRPGVGTVVRSQTAMPNLVHDASNVEDLLQITRQTSIKILQRKKIVADQSLANFIPCKVGQEWLALTMLRFLPNFKIPIAYLTTYLRPEFSSIVPRVELVDVPIFRMVEREQGQRLREIRQEITAISLTQTEAKALRAKPGFHALQVLRRFYDAQDRITQVTIAKYPGGRFTHTAIFRLKRSDRN